jgi:hypothetical protein
MPTCAAMCWCLRIRRHVVRLLRHALFSTPTYTHRHHRALTLLVNRLMASPPSALTPAVFMPGLDSAALGACSPLPLALCSSPPQDMTPAGSSGPLPCHNLIPALTITKCADDCSLHSLGIICLAWTGLLLGALHPCPPPTPQRPPRGQDPD